MATVPESAAPGELDLVRQFVNTLEAEAGHDAIDAPEKLAGWLAERGLGHGEVHADDVARARALREALRAVLLHHNGAPLDPDARAAFDAAAAGAALGLALDEGGRPRLVPRLEGAGGGLARLLAIVATAAADGTWERLKACPASACRWAFYDHSRNRSRTWCTMAECGNRAKVRAYRRRRATA